MPNASRLAKLAGIILGSAAATAAAAWIASGRANAEPEQQPHVSVSGLVTPPTISAPTLTTADIADLRRSIEAQGQRIEGLAGSVGQMNGRLSTIEGYMQGQRDEKFGSRTK